MGDFDGDGILTVDVSQLVREKELAQDSYRSMLDFQRETLGYDMMLPEFWSSEAPAQYYADHFYVPAYKSVMKKIGGRGLNATGENANVVTRAQWLTRQHGAIGQMASYVSSSYQTQFMATLAAVVLRHYPVEKFTWIENVTYQAQALYEVALGGYSPDMCRVAFGLLDRAFRLSKSTEWWMDKVDSEIVDKIRVNTFSAPDVLGTMPREKEPVLFNALPVGQTMEAMQACGFGWDGFESNQLQIEQFITLATLAGVAKKYVGETIPGAGSKAMEALKATYGTNMSLTLLLSQRLMDISRNKVQFNTPADNVRREELNMMVRGLDDQCLAVLLYKKIERTLIASASASVVTFNSGMINKLCQFVDVDTVEDVETNTETEIQFTQEEVCTKK
jgi:hypothetical protein